MVVIELKTHIRATPQVVFDLARSVDAHLESASSTGEKVVGGITQGLLELGDEVIWEARHLFMTRRLHVKITAMDSPYLFIDEMVPGSGAFKSMRHRHGFQEKNGGTLMTDRFEFRAPLGILGQIVEMVYLKRYMMCFLKLRNEALKQIAEKACTSDQ